MPGSIFDARIDEGFEIARTPRTRRVRTGAKNVQIATPFASPADWRDQWIYFILLDRFNNPALPPRSLPYDREFGEFQGGTFEGVRAQLDYLARLGVGALWLSPVLKNCRYNPNTYHGYGIQDFLAIEPRFCKNPELAARDPRVAEEELRNLVDEAHARGIYVVLDVVLNHAGDVFEYLLPDGSTAPAADWSWFPYGIRWRDESGRGRSDWALAPETATPDAAIWPRELCRNELFRRQGRGGEAGGDFESLKELVTAFEEWSEVQGRSLPVRETLIRVYQYLIARFDVDGFRIDTLKYIEPDFAQAFGNAMREYALSIGKRNFFTFGEVYDDEDQIARFIGRQASADTDLMGVDAALDFPLFFRLPGAVKGWTSPADIVAMYERRKSIERQVLSSHGEASRFFVTFLDNHDQRNRFFNCPPDDQLRYADQLTLGLTLLFSLQGIPCLYYGTEQGLHGTGATDAAVREALWGRRNAFSNGHALFQSIEALAQLRALEAPLRYGRQYFRPLSGDGRHFGISPYRGGVLAFSRILNDDEVLIVANLDIERAWSGEVLVDVALQREGRALDVVFSNKTYSPHAVNVAREPAAIVAKNAGTIEVQEPNGSIGNGPAKAARLHLEAMEVQVLRRPRAG